MEKVFLSHSSFDKDFVEQVYQELGAAHCVFDSATFSKNCDLPAQIRSGIEECSIYALFLSKQAIESKWVTTEIDIAHELKSAQQIKKLQYSNLMKHHGINFLTGHNGILQRAFPRQDMSHYSF